MDRTAPASCTRTDATPGPDSDERVLAALAYLGYLAGLWLLAPIVLYVLRRKHSRFVAHHAVRALLLQLLLVPLGALLIVLGMLFTLGAMSLLETLLGPGTSAIVLAAMTTLAFTGLAPVALVLILTLIAAVRAYQGEIHPETRLGRASEWLLRRDPGVIDE